MRQGVNRQNTKNVSREVRRDCGSCASGRRHDRSRKTLALRTPRRLLRAGTRLRDVAAQGCDTAAGTWLTGFSGVMRVCIVAPHGSP